MPNWCTNWMTVKGQEEDVQAFANAVVDVEERDNEVHNIPATIFQKLLPMPENGHKKMTTQDGKELGYAFADPKTDGDDFINGWDWCNNNWGTKWGDCDTTFSNMGDSLEFFYQTAWSPANYTKISEMFPNLTFIIRFEEGGMAFLGAEAYRNGERIAQEEGTYPEYSFHNEMTEQEEDEIWENLAGEVEENLEVCYLKVLEMV